MFRSTFRLSNTIKINPRFLVPIRSFAIHNVNSLSEVQLIASKDSSRLYVVDFKATYCQKCQILLPEIEKLNSEYEKNNKPLDFIIIDTDKMSDADKKAAGMKGLPTVHFIKNQEVLDEFIGPHINKLRSKVKQYTAL